MVGAERLAVGRLEIGANRCAARPVADAHEARRLGIADRGRERGEIEMLGQHRLVRHFVGAKMAHVPPPYDELGERGLKSRVQLGRFARRTGRIPRRGRSSAGPSAQRAGAGPQKDYGAFSASYH